ncbi:Acid phosphatase [hydrothermal vent metagenome]|uniref:Acid phosphatase n=1 Tax=hydrothermal vent metagenome TaxID=652676 RepID=A0A3B0XD55_9ZZZZ
MTHKSQLPMIDHFVVLMLENRSFDHMLGFLYADKGNVSATGQAFEGLTGTESNPNGQGEAVKAFKIKKEDENAYFMPGSDPGEGYFNTNEQLFSNHIAPDPVIAATNQGFVINYEYTLNWEKTSKWSILPGTQGSDIMGMFTPQMLPVLSTLAKSYAVCDHWYCSVPTETLPNRAFLAMGTSQGRLTDKDKLYTAPTIFSSLEKNHYTWSIYGYDAEPLSRASYADITHSANEHFGQFSDFKKAAENETLANYVFLEPQWGKGGNSQHPNYDVSKGEQLIKEVYDTLRNSRLWEKTLLIITYDEHGGCYDHVAPPENAVPPDSNAGQYGFDFTRFGPRVPALLISAYIEQGTVFRVPQGSMPLDHTSILKTLEKRFSLQPLSARDAAASDFSDVLSLSCPRDDNPLQGISAPVSKSSVAFDDAPDHLQAIYVDSMKNLPVEDVNRHEYTEEESHFNNSKEALAYGNRRYKDYFYRDKE